MKKGSEKKNGARKAIGIIIALLIVAALVFGFVKGYITLEDGGKIHFDFNPKTPTNTVEPANNANTAPSNASDNTGPGGNTVPDNSSGNSNTVPDNTANTVPDINTNTVEPDDGTANTVPDNSSNTVTPDNSSNTVPDNGSDNTPAYYTSADLKKLKNTEVFDKTAIEHIFIGTVNSNNKGSGYHYNMISDSKGQIIDGTRSKADKNGIYTANVEVDGRRKDAISSFYPDSWSPQDVVDAIVEARADALKTGKMRGSYHVGYSNGIRIDLYLDSKNKVVTAYPVKNGK